MALPIWFVLQPHPPSVFLDGPHTMCVCGCEWVMMIHALLCKDNLLFGVMTEHAYSSIKFVMSTMASNIVIAVICLSERYRIDLQGVRPRLSAAAAAASQDSKHFHFVFT